MNTHMGIYEDLNQNSASVYRSENCFEWNLQRRKQYVLHVQYISTASLGVEEIKKKNGSYAYISRLIKSSEMILDTHEQTHALEYW
jgi:hypothetical protein